MNAADSISGLVGDPSANGERITTGSRGAKTVAQTAADLCGNQQTASLNYRVLGPGLGVRAVLERVRGRVRIRRPGSASGARAAQKGRGFVPFTPAARVPIRSLVDTRKGRVRLTSRADTQRHRSRTAEFSGGRLPGAPVAQAQRQGPDRAAPEGQQLPTAAPGPPRQRRRRRGGVSRRRRIRRLRGNGKGRFRTRGPLQRRDRARHRLDSRPTAATARSRRSRAAAWPCATSGARRRSWSGPGRATWPARRASRAAASWARWTPRPAVSPRLVKAVGSTSSAVTASSANSVGALHVAGAVERRRRGGRGATARRSARPCALQRHHQHRVRHVAGAGGDLRGEARVVAAVGARPSPRRLRPRARRCRRPAAAARRRSRARPRPTPTGRRARRWCGRSARSTTPRPRTRPAAVLHDRLDQRARRVGLLDRQRQRLAACERELLAERLARTRRRRTPRAARG